MKTSSVKSVIYAMFFISGFTGLVYELMWTRMLTTVFGSTTYAITSVLSAFMGGMAIGSYVIGRYIERKKAPILVYAMLEVGVGLAALLIPQVFALLDRLYPLIYEQTTSQAWVLVVTKVVLSLLVLIFPTFLMGGTLPVLSKLFVRHPEESGRQVGILYAVNTVGAAIGCFVTGFVFIEHFGVARTTQLAAGVNLFLGIAFFLLNMRYEKTVSNGKTIMEEKGNRVPQPVGDGAIQPFYSALILVGFCLAGFVSLSYELLWTRLLVFKLKMTVYGFAIMLTTFLVGLSLGSLVAALLEKHKLIRNHARAFGVVQSLIGLMGLGTILLFGQVDAIARFDQVGFSQSAMSWNELVVAEMLMSAMIMIVPTTLMGMTLPLVSRIFTRNVAIVGKTIGSIYSVNTIGGILGSCLTGFVLVKALGTQTSIILVSLVALTFGTAIVALNRRGMGESKPDRGLAVAFTAVVWVLSTGLIVWLPKDTLLKFYNIFEEQAFKDARIVYASEGIEGITTVHEYPGGFRGISTSSVNVAGTHYTHRTTQKLQAHVPMLVHPQPRDVLQVGFGSGETSHIVTTYDIEQLDLVEISRDVIDTATAYFGDINKNVANDPKFNPIIMDGANYIHLTQKKYDLILNDASWPGYTGCSALYSRDYFEDARALLKPGGIMTSWFPITEGEDFRILLQTFHSVFPYVSVWTATTHVNQHALVLGSVEEIEINAPDFVRRFEQYAQDDLKSVDLDNPVFFLDTYLIDETALGHILDEAVPIHTIDHPILEFTERERDAVENISALRMMVGHDASIASHLTDSADVYLDGEPLVQALQRTRQATKLVIEGYIRVIGSGEYQPRFESEFKEALVIEPRHPGANHFFFKMLDIHLGLAGGYAGSGEHNYAAYCYKLAFEETAFYISVRPDSARAYHDRGLILLNGGDYLGLDRTECLIRARDDLATALALSPAYGLDHDLESLIHTIGYALEE